MKSDVILILDESWRKMANRSCRHQLCGAYVLEPF